MLDGAQEVLSQAHCDCTKREQRRQHGSRIRPERIVNLRKRPSTEGEVCDLSPGEPPAAVDAIRVFVVGSCFTLELLARHAEEATGFAEPIRRFALEKQLANVQCAN